MQGSRESRASARVLHLRLGGLLSYQCAIHSLQHDDFCFSSELDLFGSGWSWTETDRHGCRMKNHRTSTARITLRGVERALRNHACVSRAMSVLLSLPSDTFCSPYLDLSSPFVYSPATSLNPGNWSQTLPTEVPCNVVQYDCCCLSWIRPRRS